jgi:hypothetical protein
MWAVYGPALHEAVGCRLSSEESAGLAALLGRLIARPGEAEPPQGSDTASGA